MSINGNLALRRAFYVSGGRIPLNGPRDYAWNNPEFAIFLEFAKFPENAEYAGLHEFFENPIFAV